MSQIFYRIVVAVAVLCGATAGRVKRQKPLVLQRGAFLTVQEARTASGDQALQQATTESRLLSEMLSDAEEAAQSAGSLLQNSHLQRFAGVRFFAKGAILIHKNHTSMVAELGLLKRLYFHLKGNIVASKQSDQSNSAQQKETVQVLQSRLAEAEKELEAASTPNARPFKLELLRRRVDLLTHQLSHWKNDGTAIRQEFHAMLKTTHGMMARVKIAMDVYTKAIAGKEVDAHALDNLSSLPTPSEALTQFRSGVQHYKIWIAKLEGKAADVLAVA